MRKRKIFLRWCLVNILTLAFMAAAIFSFWQIASALNLDIGIGVYIGAAIIVIFGCAALYCGLLSWKADELIENLETADVQDADKNIVEPLHLLLSQAKHIDHAAEDCPYVGLMGAATGLLLLSIAKTNSANFKESSLALLSAFGVAVIPTIIGIFCMRALLLQLHLLANPIEYAIEKFERRKP